MPPRLGRLPNRLTLPGDSESARTAAKPWRRLYHTARWQALRDEIFNRDLWTCKRCAVLLKRGKDSDRSAVADHIVKHNGDPTLFWAPDNIQSLCKRCHDSDKQREEHGR